MPAIDPFTVPLPSVEAMEAFHGDHDHLGFAVHAAYACDLPRIVRAEMKVLISYLENCDLPNSALAVRDYRASRFPAVAPEPPHPGVADVTALQVAVARSVPAAVDLTRLRTEHQRLRDAVVENARYGLRMGLGKRTCQRLIADSYSALTAFEAHHPHLRHPPTSEVIR